MVEARRRRPEPAAQVLKERAGFAALLAKNPNYFGNLAEAVPKPVKKVVSDTAFEELTCVSFNPRTNFLEATIAVKRATGYGGGLCGTGSTEYVRFFLDYGSGWQDVGLAAVRVHDIPTGRDCAEHVDKPLTYIASLRLDPNKDCCFRPVLPKVHAILSWQWAPPAGSANAGWTPVWGNSLDRAIQIQPRDWSIACLIELLGEQLGQKIEIPEAVEAGKLHPIPLPDPPPLKLAQLADLYAEKAAGARTTARRAAAERFSVEPHRFGTAAIHPLIAPGGFDDNLYTGSLNEWTALGLDLGVIVGMLDDTKANVSYEELECLGLDEGLPERLVATIRIKRPTGYSGDLCHAGSIEYVAFWADWDNECEWTYIGTTKVPVHDISQIPPEGLCYAAILPVDLTHHRRSCRKPKIARVRAVLSWAVPPSTVDPDDLMYWGNRLDAHVQIAPGDEIPPPEVLAKIRNIGGIAIEDIDTAGNGMTKAGVAPAVFFAHHPWAKADAWGLGRACPFGGIVEMEGYFFHGYYYRIRVHKVGDPPGTFTVLANSFLVERWDSGFDLQAPLAGGFFAYLDPALYADIHLAYWSTSQDDLWEVQLDIATAPNEASIIACSPAYRIQLDNTAPAPPPAALSTIDIHIAAGGDCKSFDQGMPISGTFVADDLHFGGWSLSTEPNTVTTPSNPPQPDPFLAGTNPAPGPAGHGWKLDTAAPVTMKPCGYVVRLDVWDRTIVNSVPYGHNWNHIEVGFCLREKA